MQLGCPGSVVGRKGSNPTWSSVLSLSGTPLARAAQPWMPMPDYIPGLALSEIKYDAVIEMAYEVVGLSPWC